MDVFPTVTKNELLCTKYKPHCYKGQLLQEILDIADDLKILINVDQMDVEMNDLIPYLPHISCTYRICIKVIKNGFVCPYMGSYDVRRQRVRTDLGFFNYAKLTLSNTSVVSELTKYLAIIRVVFREPYDDKFHSTIVVSF